MLNLDCRAPTKQSLKNVIPIRVYEKFFSCVRLTLVNNFLLYNSALISYFYFNMLLHQVCPKFYSNFFVLQCAIVMRALLIKNSWCAQRMSESGAGGSLFFFFNPPKTCKDLVLWHRLTSSERMHLEPRWGQEKHRRKGYLTDQLCCFCIASKSCSPLNLHPFKESLQSNHWIMPENFVIKVFQQKLLQGFLNGPYQHVILWNVCIFLMTPHQAIEHNSRQFTI